MKKIGLKTIFIGITMILVFGAGPVWAAEQGSSVGTTTAAKGTTTTATAQQDKVMVLGFQQALAVAKENNKSYRMAAEKVKQANAVWWQAMLQVGPSATLQGGYVLDNRPATMLLDFGGGIPPQELEMSTNYYAGQLVVTQPLFTGLKIYNGVVLSGLQAETARAEKILAGNKLYQDVAETYFGVLVAESMLSVMQELVKQTEEHLAVVKARHREGSASNYDLLRSQVQLANLKPQVLQAENGAILARRSLTMTLGLNSGEEVQLTESLSVPVAESWPGLNVLQDQALERRLEIQNLDRSRRMAGISHTLAATSNLPNVALTGTWTYYDTQDQGFPPEGENLDHYWTVMLGFEWTFWDNLAAWPKTEAAAAQIRQTELGQEALEQGIRLDVESAYLTLQASQETIVAQEKAIQQAEAGYRIASEQFANGLMTNIDVMDAQLALNQSKINYLQTQYNYIRAKIRLQNAVGENLDQLLSNDGQKP